MNQNEFLEQFASQFDNVNVADITMDTQFRTLEEWSSMMALMVIAMVDEEYQVPLTGADVKESQTIGDIYNKVAAKVTA